MVDRRRKSNAEQLRDEALQRILWSLTPRPNPAMPFSPFNLAYQAGRGLGWLGDPAELPPPPVGLETGGTLADPMPVWMAGYANRPSDLPGSDVAPLSAAASLPLGSASEAAALQQLGLGLPTGGAPAAASLTGSVPPAVPPPWVAATSPQALDRYLGATAPSTLPQPGSPGGNPMTSQRLPSGPPASGQGGAGDGTGALDFEAEQELRAKPQLALRQVLASLGINPDANYFADRVMRRYGGVLDNLFELSNLAAGKGLDYLPGAGEFGTFARQFVQQGPRGFADVFRTLVQQAADNPDVAAYFENYAPEELVQMATQLATMGGATPGFAKARSRRLGREMEKRQLANIQNPGQATTSSFLEAMRGLL